MTDKEQILIKDINETGFYCAVDDTERLYIYEAINNTNKKWLKKYPKAKFLIDEWIYDHTDFEGRKVYYASGNLVATYNNISTGKVYKIKDAKFKIYGNCGQFLIEDKLSYQEQLARKTQEYENLKKDYKELEQRHNGAFKDFEQLKQECEELKEVNSRLLQRLEVDDSDTGIVYRQELELQNKENEFYMAVKNLTRYRKALEEIERVCIKDTRKFADGTELRYDSLDDILDIINKAKGEE